MHSEYHGLRQVSKVPLDLSWSSGGPIGSSRESSEGIITIVAGGEVCWGSREFEALELFA